MPEPVLSTIASTIAVATLAYQSTKSLISFIESIKDAPRFISDLTGDVKELQRIVGNVEVLLENRDDRSITHDARVCLSSARLPLENCRTVSEEFEQMLKKWFEGGSGSITAKLKVDFKEAKIKALHGRLKDCRTALHISLTVCEFKFNGIRAEAAERHEQEMEKQIHLLTGKLEGLELSRQEILDAAESLDGQNQQLSQQQNEFAHRFAQHEILLREAVKVCVAGLHETAKVSGNRVKLAKTMEQGRQIVAVIADSSGDISGGMEIDEMIATGTSRQVGLTNDPQFALEFLK